MVQKQQSPSSPADSGRADEPETSRADIARALASKDPTFFRQTADRGVTSAAYRKNQVEGTDTVDHGRSTTQSGRQLHGLARQPSVEPDTISNTSPLLGLSPKISDASSPGSMFSTVNSPKPATSSSASPHVPSPFSGDDSYTSRIMSGDAINTNSRTGSRSASPTKGMGGFVSSAMLRSDSVSRQKSSPAAGLARADSNARFRRLNRTGSKDGIPLASSVSRLGDDPISTLENRPVPSPAPDLGRSSRNGDNGTPEVQKSRDERSDLVIQRPVTPSADRSSVISPPLSPSKRWSPTKNKSSWLESALGKPSSPKPTPLLASRNQPAWLTDLNKNKQQRMSKDIPAEAVREAMSKLDEAPMLPDANSQAPENRIVPAVGPAQVPKPKPKPARLSEGPQDQDVQDRESKRSEKIVAEPQNMDAQKQKPESQKISTSDVTSTKPRPITPPKKDFRSSLRSTPASPEKQHVEPEFKRAFNKLKPTQTQNYKAPDVLKNNITAGKAALAQTDGPQKTVRRDEFKESILERKKTMKDNVPDPKLLHKPKPSIEKKEEQIPEALAKKRVLGRHESSGNVQSSALEAKVTPTTLEETLKPTVAGRQQPGIPTNPAYKLSSKASEKKLAERFNPGLANLIARGPGAVGGMLKSSEEEKSQSHQSGENSSVKRTSEEPQAGGQLQHMTKSRARGPKRRAPKSNAEPASSQPAAKATPQPDTLSNPRPKPYSTVAEKPATPTKQPILGGSKPTPPSSSRKVSSSATGLGQVAKISSKPPASAPESNGSKDVVREKPESHSPSLAAGRNIGTVSANKEPEAVSVDRAMRPKSISVKDATAKWGQQSQVTAPEKIKSTIKLPTRSEQPETPTKPTVGPFTSDTEQKPSAAQAKPPIPAKTLETPKLRERSPDVEQQRNVSNASVQSAAKSPGSQTSDASKILEDFFGVVPSRPNTMDFDTQALLAAPGQADAKIKTLRKELFEITVNGKKTALPSHQEHILYSESMYICTHVFGDQKGARLTETYLWLGKSVSESAAEDVQIFAKRVARDANGTLVVLRQGKETAAFMQAIGGILITRQGSSRQQEGGQRSLMLCGRRFFGHVVFDEVDFALSSLAAGFAFISTAQAGKIYVWIGVGCHADELGSARLIAMDLGPAAEVVEVEQGKEAADFLSQFPEPRRVPRSAEHWRRKPNHDNYRTRLYKVEQGPTAAAAAPINALWGALTRRPSHPDTSSGQVRIEEITPFAQSDLEEEHIYVLDAFFEVYMYVYHKPVIRISTDKRNRLPGSLSNASGAAFATALLFAQDYGMMAASLEDRPFVPVSTVVMSGAPRDMKASFRAWDDSRVDSSALMGGSGTGRMAPLKIIGLGAAIAALTTEGQAA